MGLINKFKILEMLEMKFLFSIIFLFDVLFTEEETTGSVL